MLGKQVNQLFSFISREIFPPRVCGRNKQISLKQGEDNIYSITVENRKCTNGGGGGIKKLEK